MKRDIPIKLKSVFLLIVFYLDMIVVFASPTRIDMAFNTKYQEKTEIIAQKGYHHQYKAGIHNKVNYCYENVLRFSGVDKTFPGWFAGPGNISFTTLVSSFYNIDFLHTSVLSGNIKYFVLGHHPPVGYPLSYPEPPDMI